MTRPTAAPAHFPYAHPTVEEMRACQILMDAGEPEMAERLHAAAVREAFVVVRAKSNHGQPSSPRAVRGPAPFDVAIGGAGNSRVRG